jgi:hypothetical protein
VWSSLHQAAWSFHREQDKEAPTPHLLEQPEKSAVAKHSVNLGHCFQLQDTTILSTKTTCMDRMIREAIEKHEQGKWLSSQLVMEALIYPFSGSKWVQHCQSPFGH